MEKPGVDIGPGNLGLVSIIQRTLVSGTKLVPDTKRALARALVMVPGLATVVKLMFQVLALALVRIGVGLMPAMGKVVINTLRVTVHVRKATAPTVPVMVVAMSPVPIAVRATKRALVLATPNTLLTMVITRKILKS
jgi:hypothetical protein